MYGLVHYTIKHVLCVYWGGKIAQGFSRLTPLCIVILTNIKLKHDVNLNKTWCTCPVHADRFFLQICTQVTGNLIFVLLLNRVILLYCCSTRSRDLNSHSLPSFIVQSEQTVHIHVQRENQIYSFYAMAKISEKSWMYIYMNYRLHSMGTSGQSKSDRLNYAFMSDLDILRTQMGVHHLSRYIHNGSWLF